MNRHKMFWWLVFMCVIASLTSEEVTNSTVPVPVVQDGAPQTECQDNCDRLCRYGRTADMSRTAVRRLRGCKKTCGRLRCRLHTRKIIGDPKWVYQMDMVKMQLAVAQMKRAAESAKKRQLNDVMFLND